MADKFWQPSQGETATHHTEKVERGKGAGENCLEDELPRKSSKRTMYCRGERKNASNSYQILTHAHMLIPLTTREPGHYLLLTLLNCIKI